MLAPPPPHGENGEGVSVYRYSSSFDQIRIVVRQNNTRMRVAQFCYEVKTINVMNNSIDDVQYWRCIGEINIYNH